MSKNVACTNADEIADLFRKGRIAVFCGAGISFNSGIPVVSQIVSCILTELGAAEEEQRALLQASIPFELFMQTLKEQGDVALLFDMFDGGEPNTNHFFLAKLIRDGLVETVCTTNFDTLLERALTASGMIEGRDYSVFCSDKEFGEIDWSSELPKLIKIHGSVTNRAEMAVTLRQVAARVLTAGREQIVDRFFHKGTHDTTLVFGYSCSDQFDISPRIESYGKSPIEVLLVEHDRARITEELVGVKEERNPFRKFLGRRLFLNTDDLVRELWTLLLNDPYRFVSGERTDIWKKRVQTWAIDRRLGDLQQTDTISALLFAAGRPKLGLARLRVPSEVRADTVERLVFLINQGAGSGQAGRFDDAIRFLKEALGIALAFNDPRAIGQVLANLGGAYKQKGHISRALEISLEAERNATAKQATGQTNSH